MTSTDISTALAPDWTMRPAVLDDAPTVLALLHAVSLKMVGQLEEDIEGVQTDWTAPNFDLAQDTRLVLDSDGQIVGYAITYLDPPMASQIDIYLQPERWQTDSVTEPYLLDWAMRRATDAIERAPDGMRVVVNAWMHSHDARYGAMLSSVGMSAVRRGLQMRIDIDAPPQPPAPIDAVVIRIAEDGDDRRAVLEAIMDGWRDHRGYIERDFEERYQNFTHQWKDIYVPGAWILALDGERIVGASLCLPSSGGDATIGYVSMLSVRRAYRRRGIALALLRASFVALYGMGCRRAILGVDAASLTGATKLYEKAGMVIDFSYTMYERELRPGYNPAVTSLDA
ncbi:MAG: GNAT family N-acetyltransferase [Chloroflexota bacterium]|nr:GNAT family N-acetyltransferase [Chloroflexota bacterium]